MEIRVVKGQLIDSVLAQQIIDLDRKNMQFTLHYFDDGFVELRLDDDFLAVGWSFVRSTILLFLIT